MLALFHLSVFALNVYTLWYDQMYVELPFPSKDLEKIPFKARILFVTVWSLVTQTLYFGLAFLNDIVGTNVAAPKKPPLIRKIKDALFSLAFPASIYVATFFWCVYAIDKELIFPDAFVAKIPAWVNHVMHTLILPFTVAEMLFSKITYPSRTLGLSITMAFSISYLSWINIVFAVIGVYPYPFLSVAPWPVRIIILFVTVFVFSPASYLLCERLHCYAYPSKAIAQYRNGLTNGHSNGFKKH